MHSRVDGICTLESHMKNLSYLKWYIRFKLRNFSDFLYLNLLSPWSSSITGTPPVCVQRYFTARNLSETWYAPSYDTSRQAIFISAAPRNPPFLDYLSSLRPRPGTRRSISCKSVSEAAPDFISSSQES